ncbi:MAG: YibE/F family protein, partial [Bacilli bacterium]|nr:YibE/F family protein [Bacilli bacterium]
IFLESLFIGGLGAIMDVAITMSSSIYELKQTSKKITRKEIIKSSKQIGSDILPTMINVLFFTYFSSELAVFVLAIRNGFTVSNFINTFYPLEITRLLTGSIGIVLTIPVAIYTSLWVYQKEGRK